MKVSLNWAQKYSQADLRSLSVDELIKLATERLGGIEGVTDLSKHYEGIVVAKVVSCSPHPNADKLKLCLVDDGGAVKDVTRDEKGYVQVVCGAPNAREGLTVAWIPPGAIVPASYGEKELFVLEARDLRGQISNGMLASPAELGMSDDHSGILEIDEEAKPGTPFAELYSLDDLIIDIENKMFTHRPDCFGQLGVARELAGIQSIKFQSPDWYAKGSSLGGTARGSYIRGLSVTIEDSDLCPRYMAVVIDNVKVAPSPLWLQSKLKRVGIRPINNVVDITNYMMMLTAQPLHAFDFDKIAKNGKADIIVRRPKDGEKLTLLDGKMIEPHNDAVLICSTNPRLAHSNAMQEEGEQQTETYTEYEEGAAESSTKQSVESSGSAAGSASGQARAFSESWPIALGGVMGGGNSEVDENTKTVVLECATFNMYNIRKTSMIHGIFTDAVTRFTKGQPAAQLPPVLYKAVQMFDEIIGAQKIGNVADAKDEKLSLFPKPVQVSVDFINERLGSNLSSEEIIEILENVEFSVKMGEELTVSVPFWRTDIEIPEDIVEEVGRLYGFNNLPLKLPTRSITPVQPDSRLQLKKQIREDLSKVGANEVLTYSFVRGDLLKKVGQDSKHAFKIRNALSPDLQYYRLSLTPSLLDKVHSNIKSGFESFALFELGKSHFRGEMDEAEPEVPNEDEVLAFVLAYDDKVKPNGAAYFQARKYLELITPEVIEKPVPLKDFDLSSDEWDAQFVSAYEPSRSAVIVISGQIWGVVGEFKPSVKKALKLPEHSAGFEVHLDVISPRSTKYLQLSKYPSSSQDLTLQVDQSVSYGELKAVLDDVLRATKYQWELEPISIFQKEGSKEKNITFHLKISHHERTLKTIEVNKLIEQLGSAAKEKVNAKQV